MDNLGIPKEICDITKTLKGSSFEAYLVGGCVRDLLRGKKPKDWDIATDANPDEIQPLFEHTHYENAYGTVGVVNEETDDETLKVVEITPYRVEGTYSDRRRPDTVTFGKDVLEDLARRDFTVNAIAFDPETKKTVDPYKGQDDIEKCLLRAVGVPGERFEEDGLRILRAIRLQAELGFTIEEETLEALHVKRSTLSHIAKERIRDEFSRIVNSNRPAAALEMARRLELLEYIVPELQVCVGIEQTKAHKYDVFSHLLYSLQHTADKRWPFHVKLAALFHDIGKPPTRRRSPKKDDHSFYGHEVVGARITEKALKRLAFSRETVELVTLLVRWHMFFADPEKISLSAVRRLLSRVGKEHIWDLINLRIADRVGTGRPKEEPYRLRKYQAMIEEVMSDPVSVGMLTVDGSDVMKETGLAPGPKVGFLLHALLEEVLDDPTLNTKQYLLKRSGELAALSDSELKALGEKGKTSLDRAEDERTEAILKQYRVS